MKIKSRLLLTSILVTVLVVAVISFVFSYRSINRNKKSTLQYARELLEQEKDNLKTYTDIAYSIIVNTYEKGMESGDLDGAKSRIIEQIKAMRYDGGTGYFWINDSSRPYSRMVVHPISPQLDGRILDDPSYNCALGRDENLFTAMVDITRDNDDGFVDYMWPKPGRTELAPKLSYVRIFRPLGWIVGTGIYIDHIDAARAQRELQNSAQVRQTIFTVVTVGAVLLLLSSVVFYIFAAALTKPLVRVTGIAAKIAEGDLEIEKIRLRSKDETAILTESFMRMIEVLREKAKAIEKIASGDLTVDIHTISEKDKLGMSLTLMKESLNEILNLVNDAVDQVFLGSDQISLSSQSLAQGATQQASSLQEIGETLAGINSRSRKNAEHAAEASAYAGNTSETAASGNMKMGELTDTMARIVASSDEINKVVKVIDDIAFQINLLALNANVEAARAGKYGKGFAVVADEVRNLANRSAEAVKETSSMVEQTISGIRDGNRVVKETAVHFQDIVTGIEKVTAFIEEIDNASREQAEGIEQITEAVEQIEKVTESNTAGAEETAAATESLAKQAKQLREMLSRFRLESGGKTGYLPAPEEPDNWE